MVGAAHTGRWYMDLEAVRVEVGQHQVVGHHDVNVQAASGVEFVLEGLHLTRRLAKELTDDGRTLYGS